MRTQMIITAGLALALSSPVALAYWSGHGGYEPDYPADVTLGYMWPNPDVDPSPAVQQVYFNAFMEPEWSSVNPNVGALQSRVITPDFQMPAAYLGVWKDCNSDGYIGAAESALLVYRSQLLLETEVCEDGTTHNSGGWVYEFRWIGSAENALGPDSAGAPARMINDTAARVWGDADLPGDLWTPDCWINPAEGFASSTGAMFGYADCLAQNAPSTVLDTADPGGLSFDDAEQPQCSESPLNVRQNVFADEPACPTGQTGLYEDRPEEDEDAAFTAFDCAAGTTVPVPAGPLDQDVTVDGSAAGLGEATVNPDTLVTEDDGNLATVFVAAPSSDPAANPTGSYYEALDNAYENTADQCAEDDAGLVYASPESNVAQGSDKKRESDFTLYFEGYSGVNIAATFADIFLDIIEPDLIEGALGDTPPDGGQGVFFDAQGLRFAPMWSSASGKSVEPYLVRGDATPAGPQYYTFYAYVTPSAGLTLPGNSGVYAAEWCNDSAYALAMNVDCEPANWYDQSLGARAMPTEAWSGNPIGQAPGASYNLRDTDCYDGSVTGLVPDARGIGLGLTPLDEQHGPCEYYEESA